MKKQHRTKKERFSIRTHLIHGNRESNHWDFDHHLVPPISASAAYRLGSVHRGAQGFVEFASGEADVMGHIPLSSRSAWSISSEKMMHVSSQLAWTSTPQSNYSFNPTA